MTTFDTPTPALAGAQLASERGWRPFPIDHPGLPKCIGRHRPGKECAPGVHKKRGKHPAVHWPTATASVQSPQMLAMWFGGAPRNIGIACKPSGLFVVDEDETDALERRARQLGEVLPDTYRVRTGRGWHWYFDATQLEQVLGNDAGRLADFGMDVRGGSGDGGYVVAAGSVHWTGALYVAEDDYKALVAPPAWLINEVLTPAQGAGVRSEGEQGRHGGEDEWGGPGLVGARGNWTDDPRYGSEFDLLSQYHRHVAAIRSQGNSFRHELFVAARDGWRLVACQLIEQLPMLQELAAAVERVWGAPPNLDDKHIVMSEAREAALLSPWVLSDGQGWDPWGKGGQPAGDSDEAGGDAVMTSAETAAPSVEGEQQVQQQETPRPDPFELEVLYEVRKQDIRDEARRRRARRDRADKPSLKSRLINVRQLHTVKPPTLLVGRLIPERGVGFLAGKYGSYKTFAAVSLACSIAAGRAWMDDQQFTIHEQKRVLYVAAEGAADVAERVQAWERRYCEIGEEWMDVHDEPIRLADPDEVAELAELVREGGHGFIVIDTFHRSASGVQENSNSEVGVIFSAMAGIRDESGATVMFVDHTGHTPAGGTARIRDASSKGDDSDFVLIADMPGEDRSAANQRTLTVQKLKSWPTGTKYPLRLVPAPGVSMWQERKPMLLEVGEIDHAQAFTFEPTWFDGEAAEVPEELSALRGKGANAARDIFRILRHIDSDTGVTEDAVRQMLGEARQYHRSGVVAALSLLRRKNIVKVGDTPSKLCLADRFEPPRELRLVVNEDRDGE